MVQQKKKTSPRSKIAPAIIVRKPTQAELLAAYGRTVRDVIAPNLKVLFVGINPGLYSGAVRHHFARPGNRFWPALHKAGFTKEQLVPSQERKLSELGYGITNIVNKSTATAAELSQEDLEAGGLLLASKIKRYRPRVVAILGLDAFRHAFHSPKACFGRQKERIGSSEVWILPNPSGLNANYQLPTLSKMFRQVRVAAEKPKVNARS